ncbi:hypothetical protein AABB24_029226, partial [Solanum stoloniferum]
FTPAPPHPYSSPFCSGKSSCQTAAQPPPLSPVLLPFPALFPRRSPSFSLASLLPLVSPANGSGTQLLRQSPASSGQLHLGRRRTTGEIFLSPSSQLLHSPASKAVAATKRTSSEQLRQTTAPTKREAPARLEILEFCTRRVSTDPSRFVFV